MKKLLITACIVFCTQSAFALLSPLNQSASEITTILQSRELEERLPQSQAILEIHRAGAGYILLTRELELLVKIEYLPSDRVGPQKFKIVFQEPTPVGQSQ